MNKGPETGADRAQRYRLLEREWQNEIGHALLDKPFDAPGSALVFHRQFERLRAALEGCASGPVVEVGCGRGQFLEYLAETSFARDRLLVGMDVSVAVRGLARSGIAAVQADGEFLPLRDESVAAVVYSGALHHIVNYRAAVREALRVLRPGGRLVVFEPVSSAFSQVVHRVLDPIIFRTSCEYESPVDQEYKGAFREEDVEEEMRAGSRLLLSEKSDFLAYPFTGCYAGSAFVRSSRFMQALLRTEAAFERFPALSAVARAFAWRFLLVGEKTITRPEAPRGGAAPLRLEELLCCPVCRGALERRESALRCVTCSASYVVREGVPELIAP